MIYEAPEHEFEAVHGLPAALPAGENIIWQGSPDVSSFARNAFHIRAIACYFALLLVLRGVFAIADGASFGEALISVAPLLALALVGLGLNSHVHREADFFCHDCEAPAISWRARSELCRRAWRGSPSRWLPVRARRPVPDRAWPAPACAAL